MVIHVFLVSRANVHYQTARFLHKHFSSLLWKLNPLSSLLPQGRISQRYMNFIALARILFLEVLIQKDKLSKLVALEIFFVISKPDGGFSMPHKKLSLQLHRLAQSIHMSWHSHRSFEDLSLLLLRSKEQLSNCSPNKYIHIPKVFFFPKVDFCDSQHQVNYSFMDLCVDC